MRIEEWVYWVFYSDEDDDEEEEETEKVAGGGRREEDYIASISLRIDIGNLNEQKDER